jgi:hypothetical protein
VSTSAEQHLAAAARHDEAAENHERAAGFWHDRGDEARAQLHRDAVSYERQGAALERRWAKLVDGDERSQM